MEMLRRLGVALEGFSYRQTPAGLAAHFITGKWFMVYASTVILSVAGATYIFGLYSEEMKTSLGYNQSTLNTISFAKDLGGNLGVFAGLIQEVLPPSAVLAIGAVMNLVGYLMIWLAVTGRIAKPKVWEMCLYIFLGANSQAFANTGALVTCVKNFPESRGVVLGLLKGLMGLSGAVLTHLYRAFYGDDSEALILFIGWLPTAVSLVFVYTVRIINRRRRRRPDEIRTFYHFVYNTLALVAYLMVIILVQRKITFSTAAFRASAVVVILLVLFFPFLIVVNKEFDQWKNKIVAGPPAPPPPPAIVLSVQAEKKDVLNGVAASVKDGGGGGGDKKKGIIEMFRAPARGEDHTILQALVSVDMIILFITSTCGVGGTLTAMDNLGQIGKALGYPPASIGTCVSLMSIWNCLGRLGAGFVSEIFLTKYKLPRPLLLTAVLLLACVGHLLIAFAPRNGIYVASVIVGFTFGAQWPLLFAIISEVFGLKYYSTLYNFGGMTSPVGSYILNVLVAGRLYDREARKQQAAAGVVAATKGLTCIGVECYKGSFLIITGTTLFGAVVSLVLVARTYKFYQGDIYARFREAEQEMAVKGSAGEEVAVDPTSK